MGTAAAVAFRDLTGSVYRMPLAVRLAIDDIHGRYRRTALGPLWIVLGQMAMVVSFVLVFSGMFRADPRTYALFLAAGFPVWMLISSYLSDMPQAFVQARGHIESFELPWLIHIWRRSIGYVLVFFHQIATLFIAMAILWVPPRWEMLLAAPALVVVMVAGSGVGMVLAVLGARYRDLHPTMGIVTRFLFFLSAVMWRPEQLRGHEWLVQYNPLHYMITLVRDPLLGRAPSAEVWIGASVAAVGLVAIGFFAFWLSRRRLYHWL